MPRKRSINHLFGRDYTILSRFLETVLEDEFVTFGDGFLKWLALILGVLTVEKERLEKESMAPESLRRGGGLARAKVQLEEPKDASSVSIEASTAQSRPQKKDSQQQALGQRVRV